MAQERKLARDRTRARQERLRERSLALSVGLSVLTVFVIWLLIVIVEANLPGTALFNFWRLVTAKSGFSPGSELFLQLKDQVARQDVLFIFPLSLVCGGLVLGRLSPRRVSRAHLLRVAAAVSGAMILVRVAFVWIPLIWAQHGHLADGEISSNQAAIQIGCLAGSLVAYLLGTLLGLLWRGNLESPPQALTPNAAPR